MTEQQRSAVAYVDGKPMYELAAQEVVYPAILEQDGSPFKVHFHLTPYLPREAARLMADAERRYSPGADNNVIAQAGSRDSCAQFFDSHFVRMSGIANEAGEEPSVDEQKEFLATHSYYKEQVVTGVVAAFAIEPVQAAQGGRFVIGRPSKSKVTLSLTLGSETGADEKVTLSHLLAPITAFEFGAYTRATGNTEINARKKYWKSSEDTEAVAAVYDKLI